MKTAYLGPILALTLASCGTVQWRNVQDSSRNFAADRARCEETSASSLGVTHCLRKLGWDAQIASN